MRKITQLVAALLNITFAACGSRLSAQVSPSLQPGVGEPRPAIKSTADLRRLLVPGLGSDRIVAILGEPGFKESVDEKKAEWTFKLVPFPADDKMKGAGVYVVGVQLVLTNGCLANCHYSYFDRELGVKKEVLTGSGSRSPEGHSPALGFFILSTAPLPGGQFIDTKRLPKLGFVGATPDLKIDMLTQVVVEEYRRSETNGIIGTEWIFALHLTRADAKRIETLSKANVSRTVVIMLDQEPLCALSIVSPLGTGSFLLPCTERPLMNELKRQFADMLQQSPP